MKNDKEINQMKNVIGYAITVIQLIVFSIVLISCASTPKSGVEHAGEEKVILRIYGLDSRPSWLREDEPFRIVEGKVQALGTTSMPGDGNISAGNRIAANNGKALISHAISQRLDFVFQNAEQGTVMDANQVQYIGAEASKLTTSALTQSKLYWEKVQVIQENGQSVVRYRIFTLLEMPEADFKSAIVDAIRRNQGKQGISADFAKKVEQHWNQFFVEGKETTTNDRKPAQDNNKENEQ